ncbi:MAG: hypothetical protein GYB65_04550 [Chloroflexi bacterium]|nr:hypothetical protein [Chloroflexota bacterium]
MPHPLNRWERLTLVVILAAGAWLRFQNMDDIEYNIDQVYPVWQAIQTLDNGEFPLAGQGTSVLFANPPLTGYLFVPVLALVPQPAAAYALTLLLNTLAIWLTFRGLRWLMGTRPALVGAALFATNPWIIEDSRRTWVQALLPFFVCLVFWALVPVLTAQTQHPRRRTLIALVGLALAAHTYLLAYALVAPVGVLIVLFWQRIPRRELVIGGAIFAGLMLLYGIGLAQDWDNTTNRAEEFTSGEARLSDEALSHAIRLVTGHEYASARGQDAPADDAALRQDLNQIVHTGWLVVLGVGVVLAGWYIVRHDVERRKISLILLVWAVLPVLMMSYVSRVVHPFYLLLTVPAGHGLAALAFEPLLRRPHPVMVAAVLGIAGFSGTVNGLNAVRFAQNTHAHPSADLPETLPLGEATALGERIRDEREPGMVVFSAMEEWTPVTLAGEDFRVEQVPDGRFDRALLVPPAGGLYLAFQTDPDAPLPQPLFAEAAGAPLGLRDGARIELWRVMPDAIEIAHPVNIPSDIGVSFAGWTLHGDLAPGAPVLLDTFWRIDELRPERGIWVFAPFAHQYYTDGTGAPARAVENGDVLSALTWQPGDLMAQRLTLTIPPDANGPFEVQVGLFDSVRTNEAGLPGINAVFDSPSGPTVIIPIFTGSD